MRLRSPDTNTDESPGSHVAWRSKPMSQEITLHFETSDGTVHAIDAVVGNTLMEAAVRNDIDEVIAECGGSLICSTCHVYLDEATVAVVEPPDDAELDMLEGVAAERRDNSRLSCQVVITEAMDGHTVRTPERQ